MSYYNVILLSCAAALFILVLMRLREMVTAKFIAELDREDKAREKSYIPESVVSIFSNDGAVFEGTISMKELNRLRRVDIAAKKTITASSNGQLLALVNLQLQVRS